MSTPTLEDARCPHHVDDERETWRIGCPACWGTSLRAACDYARREEREKLIGGQRERVFNLAAEYETDVRRQALKDAAEVEPLDVRCPSCSASQHDYCKRGDGINSIALHPHRWRAAILALDSNRPPTAP